MAGKRTAPNSPQTSPRSLIQRRSMRGLLDTRRELEADLRTVEVVGVFGKGFHVTKNPGGSLSYVVGDQTGGRTFAPGTQVFAGSASGAPGEVILGGPPPGKTGSSRSGGRTRRPGRRVTPEPPVEAAANQYAFYDTGTTLYCWLYDDADFFDDRGAVGSPGGVVRGIILTDSQAIVGDGSAILDDSTTWHVWDVLGGVVYDYAQPSGWLWASGVIPVYQDGYLWWVEIEDPSGSSDTISARLQKSDCDFGNLTTVSTWTSATYFENVTTVVPAQGGIGFAAAHTWFSYNGASVTPERVMILHPLNGTSPTDRSLANDGEFQVEGGAVFGLPKATGGVLMLGLYPNHATYPYTPVHYRPDDNSTDLAGFWPESFGTGIVYYLGANLNPDAGKLQVTGLSIGGDTYTYRDSAATAPTDPSPAVSFIATAHPDIGQAPESLFYFGD